MRAMACLVDSVTSSWLNACLLIPAARLVMQDNPTTFNPAALASNASGTVDMPTASAPKVRKARISAGDS